ncbi:GatB/YqeY domain-containing protein [Streptomyces sp. NBC_00083]|uniref:GatB/YqeY domain-containing protein n=1 Tax=Streptomyces sp. NBC_00083 TaxID=2975647 RepID=UPI00225316A2|nr:GatB/YqeY domain-containing protein [Streptomyces sp. NBC_00083]MCX5384324.1 GatB/YqeY domain-containing protein [Streptomyces sp. NBC_00083]
MRARDKAAVSALRSALAALDNAEAVPAGAAELRGVSVEESPVGVGVTEAARRELSERETADIVRREIAERRSAAAELTSAAHAGHAARLHEEAAVLHRFLDEQAAQ